MDEPAVLHVHAEARVERGTAACCACGGKLDEVPGGWQCAECNRRYE